MLISTIYYGRPALSGKVIGTCKIRFQIFVPEPKQHQGKNFDAAAYAISATRGNEDPDVGFEREAFPHYSRNIRQKYVSF
ncbi:hypothetical protein TNCV_2914401 [Trichonephila clavipes]|nr:hypothetical protein TNCV_2914401 [Trichonephila clavipes]